MDAKVQCNGHPVSRPHSFKINTHTHTFYLHVFAHAKQHMIRHTRTYRTGKVVSCVLSTLPVATEYCRTVEYPYSTSMRVMGDDEW